MGVPFRNQVFVIAVGVGGILEGTRRLVSGAQNLQWRCGLATHHYDGNRQGHLQPFFIQTDGTAADDAQDIVTKNRGLGGCVQ